MTLIGAGWLEMFTGGNKYGLCLINLLPIFVGNIVVIGKDGTARPILLSLWYGMVLALAFAFSCE